MEKLPGARLSDVTPGQVDVRQVLREVGAWLTELHSIPLQGFGYLNGNGIGKRATVEDWLAAMTSGAGAFEAAGRAAGLEAVTIRSWLDQIIDSLTAALPRVTLIHNDLLADHVLVHEGRFSGVIDFGEVAAEPAASDFAKWDFVEGERFPTEWMQEGYGATLCSMPPVTARTERSGSQTGCGACAGITRPAATLASRPPGTDYSANSDGDRPRDGRHAATER